MKAYIITFHWATNYGAVLQAYALQSYLLSHGYDIKIINYVPSGYKKTLLRSLRARSVKRIYKQLLEYRKEQKIEKFRKKYLCLTEKYSNQESLKEHNWENALYICGSDQIWNPFFTLHGENKVTLPYFLDFTSQGRKISYAASFGVTNISPEMEHVIVPLLDEFSRITVREKSAVSMLHKLKIKAELICDPVFLLQRIDYERLFQGKEKKEKTGIFRYILHEEQDVAFQMAESVRRELHEDFRGNVDTMSVEEWLETLSTSNFVVTNSFHAIAFSLLFHVPFVAVLIKNSGMNDRIITLLETVQLSKRAVFDMTQGQIKSLVKENIEWSIVDCNIQNMRNKAVKLLQGVK